MAKKLFGTDGIRGVAGQFPLDPETTHAFGLALGGVAKDLAPNPQIVIGMDTRESGPWIAAQVAGGLREAGAGVRFAGVVTTPGVAFLTHTDSFAAGVMISASHNPYQDNGIKVFGHSGFKLPDAQEDRIEEEIFRLREAGVKPAAAELRVDEGLDLRYIHNLLSTAPNRFDGLKIVLDCGNGAASHLAPELFRRAGAGVEAICRDPDGRNINLGCGALHLEPLQKAVLAAGADLGVAYDGDADRAIFVSKSGRVIDGDAVLLIAAREMLASGRLKNRLVVATVMSNLGLEKALEREGIRLIRTAVGDKYVLEEMLRSGAALGGEQSGHVIFTDYSTTGDGMLTALQITSISARSGKGLDELATDMEIYPQRLVNVRIREKKSLSELPSVAREMRECQEALGATGRVLVRFSGTEPLARVMVEAADPKQVEEFTTRIAGAIEREIG
ncbi:MAG TPA: phosphoglucosamine mutase [Bryobacteraceae bacterium]|nr:phosphoglucosamine mutase [Bryobacteraceae bacterium]